MPFPEFFRDTYGLLLVAEAVYTSLTDYQGELYLGLGIGNIFRRELALPRDLESFFAGYPERPQAQDVPKWIFDDETMVIGEDPIVVARRLLGHLFWRMGYRSYEPYLRLWGRGKERESQESQESGAPPGPSSVHPIPDLPEDYLATILFTDIVRSTEHKSRLGDHAWLALLAEHDAAIRDSVTRYGGRVIKHTGDGFLATFSSPTRAVLSAIEATERVDRLGLTIRAGLHTGECEVMPDDVIGIAVDTAARIMGVAGRGGVLVSSTLREISLGLSRSRGIQFQDYGVHELKGVGKWRLYTAERIPAEGDTPAS